MSPLPVAVVLDNTVVSSLHEAGALERVLRLWGQGAWMVPLQVRDEAGDWKVHGPAVLRALDALVAEGIVRYATPEPGAEGILFAELGRTLGRSESAAIAIAHQRRLAVATDDRRAARSCAALNPPLRVLATEQLLGIAVADGLLTTEEAQDIWSRVGIVDPNRGLRI